MKFSPCSWLRMVRGLTAHERVTVWIGEQVKTQRQVADLSQRVGELEQAVAAMFTGDVGTVRGPDGCIVALTRPMRSFLRGEADRRLDAIKATFEWTEKEPGGGQCGVCGHDLAEHGIAEGWCTQHGCMCRLAGKPWHGPARVIDPCVCGHSKREHRWNRDGSCADYSFETSRTCPCKAWTRPLHEPEAP